MYKVGYLEAQINTLLSNNASKSSIIEEKLQLRNTAACSESMEQLIQCTAEENHKGAVCCRFYAP